MIRLIRLSQAAHKGIATPAIRRIGQDSCPDELDDRLRSPVAAATCGGAIAFSDAIVGRADLRRADLLILLANDTCHANL
jgi:hypothetical protein